MPYILFFDIKAPFLKLSSFKKGALQINGAGRRRGALSFHRTCLPFYQSCSSRVTLASISSRVARHALGYCLPARKANRTNSPALSSSHCNSGYEAILRWIPPCGRQYRPPAKRSCIGPSHSDSENRRRKSRPSPQKNTLFAVSWLSLLRVYFQYRFYHFKTLLFFVPNCSEQEAAGRETLPAASTCQESPTGTFFDKPAYALPVVQGNAPRFLMEQEEPFSGPPFCLGLCPGLAGALHGAVGAAAAAGGFSLLLLPDQRPEDQGNHCQQNKTNQNASHIRANP